MGENEEAGLLRMVVITALISMVSFTIFATVATLKDNLHENIDNAIVPSLIIDALEPGQLTSTVSTFDGSDFSTSKSAGKVPSSMLKVESNLDVTIDTRQWASQGYTWPHGWLIVSSPAYSVPVGAKRIKYVVTLKGTTTQYVHPWFQFFDKNGNQMSESFYMTPSASMSATEFKTYTKTANVPAGAVKMRISMQAREGTYVTYRDSTATVYNW